jgi:ferredoxin
VKLQQGDQFADMLLDLAGFVRPALTLMDAVVGMDGDGPSAGDPFPIGAILGSADPTALDVAAVALIGHEPETVPTVAAAIRRGWTSGRFADLEMVGDDLAGMQVTGFRLPAGGGSQVDRLPAPLRRVAARALVANPYVTARCVGCGQCIESCPVQTIRRVQDRARIELGDCIRCYCCHELCPEQAIALRQSWVGRALARVVR